MRRQQKKASAISSYLRSGKPVNNIKGLFQKTKRLPTMGPRNLINPLYEGGGPIIKKIIK